MGMWRWCSSHTVCTGQDAVRDAPRKREQQSCAHPCWAGWQGQSLFRALRTPSGSRVRTAEPCGFVFTAVGPQVTGRAHSHVMQREVSAGPVATCSEGMGTGDFEGEPACEEGPGPEPLLRQPLSTSPTNSCLGRSAHGYLCSSPRADLG